MRVHRVPCVSRIGGDWGAMASVVGIGVVVDAGVGLRDVLVAGVGVTVVVIVGE